MAVSLSNDSDYYARLERLGAPADIPFLGWSQFLREFSWAQGEHIAMIGPTGAGKSTLALEILPEIPYTVALFTKKRDDTLNRFLGRGYHVMREWRPITPQFHPDVYPRRIVWPKEQGLRADKAQARVFFDALANIYDEGAWAVYFDELWDFIHPLKMEPEFQTLIRKGRSAGLSVMAATQRPAYVPLLIYDQSTHLFFWRDNDERNLDRIGGISAVSADRVRRAVMHLPLHDILYVNSRNGTLYRTRVAT